MAVQFGVYCPHRYSPGVGPLRKSVWQLFSDALFFGRLEATSDDDGAGTDGGDIAAGDDQHAAAVAAPLRMAHGPQPAAPGLHIAAVQDQITASFAVFAADVHHRAAVAIGHTAAVIGVPKAGAVPKRVPLGVAGAVRAPALLIHESISPGQQLPVATILASQPPLPILILRVRLPCAATFHGRMEIAEEFDDLGSP